MENEKSEEFKKIIRDIEERHKEYEEKQKQESIYVENVDVEERRKLKDERLLREKLRKEINEEYAVKIKTPDNINTYSTRTRIRYNFRTETSPPMMINNAVALDGTHDLYSMCRLSDFNSIQSKEFFVKALRFEKKGTKIVTGGLRYVVYKKKPVTKYLQAYMGDVIKEYELEWEKDRGEVIGLAFLPEV